MEDPVCFSELESDLSPPASDATPRTKHNQKRLLEFVDSKEELIYIKDMWSRESWRFVFTSLIMCLTTCFMLLLCFAQDRASTRLIALVVSFMFLAAAIFVAVLLWRSERGGERCRFLFKRCRGPLQWAVLIAGTIAVPLITAYNAFHACNQ
jgi:hypothetical protein